MRLEKARRDRRSAPASAVDYDRRNHVELSNAVWQLGEWNVNRALQMTLAPLFRTPHIDDLKAVLASYSVEACRVKLRDVLQVSAMGFPLAQNLRTENAGDASKPDLAQIGE
jgi:hypothetical protein